MRKTKNELRVAREVKSDLKGVYQILRTKNREAIGPLKSAEEEPVSSGAMSKIMNEHLIGKHAGNAIERAVVYGSRE